MFLYQEIKMYNCLPLFKIWKHEWVTDKMNVLTRGVKLKLIIQKRYDGKNQTFSHNFQPSSIVYCM